MADPVKFTPLNNPNIDQIVATFEGLAGEARRGDIVGWSAIIVRPGEKWGTSGIGEGNSIEAIGRHVLAILSIADLLTKE